MAPNINQKQKARMAQHQIELARMEAHANVVQMLKDNLVATKVIDEARKQINLWRENHLCSADYIQDWEELLANPKMAVEVLEQMTPFSIRMRQNSPFSKHLK